MSCTRLLRFRLGFGVGLLLSIAAFACLNPRPDDQPLFSGPSGQNDSVEPPVALPGDPFDDGSQDNVGGSPATGSGGGSTTQEPRSPDAGAPADAGPTDESDAETLGD